MKIGRNDPCECGSGKKYKHCCYDKDLSARQTAAAAALAEAGAVADLEADPEQGGAAGAAESTENSDTDANEREKLSFQERQRLGTAGRSYPNTLNTKLKARRKSKRDG